MLQDFYNISSRSSEVGMLSFSFTFNAQHPIFVGHFPGQPVVPGVCILQILVNELSESLGTPLEISALVQAKYLQPLMPDNIEITANATYSVLEDGNYKVSAIFSKEQSITTKIQATLSPCV